MRSQIRNKLTCIDTHDLLQQLRAFCLTHSLSQEQLFKMNCTIVHSFLSSSNMATIVLYSLRKLLALC